MLVLVSSTFVFVVLFIKFVLCVFQVILIIFPTNLIGIITGYELFSVQVEQKDERSEPLHREFTFSFHVNIASLVTERIEDDRHQIPIVLVKHPLQPLTIDTRCPLADCHLRWTVILSMEGINAIIDADGIEEMR